MDARGKLTRAGLLRPFPAAQVIGLDALQRNWDYQPTAPDAFDSLQRLMARFRIKAAPQRRALSPITAQRDRWIAYFIYLPAGRQLDEAHRYTIARLRDADCGLIIVCASSSPDHVPQELVNSSDALYWKALGGFDFSAYSIAIHEVARASPGADMFVLNDSVFGPFCSMDTLWDLMKWDLTSLTASGQVENHIQSYAFCLRNVTPQRVAALNQVLPRDQAYNDYQAVVHCQETRFARQASRSMSVGALWYAGIDVTIDPSLFAAVPLVNTGFPFMKRGLLSKHRWIYPEEVILEALKRQGHPIIRM